MKTDYKSEPYKIFEEINLISFEKKLENETAFDGIVKIYSLKTNNEIVNRNIKGKFFGDFIFKTENGVFLRMFENKDSWPKSTLIFLNLNNFEINLINKNKSSWNIWNVKDFGNGKYSVEISPTENIEFQTN
jgi:hypothetical protein